MGVVRLLLTHARANLGGGVKNNQFCAKKLIMICFELIIIR
jgi:hypothetical protein